MGRNLTRSASGITPSRAASQSGRIGTSRPSPSALARVGGPARRMRSRWAGSANFEAWKECSTVGHHAPAISTPKGAKSENSA